MDRIAVGIIRRAHGVHGEASVEPWTDSPDRFSELDTITLASPDERETRELRIESVRPHGERVLVRFAGISTPEAVQLLQNWTIEIPESEARKLEEDEYFLHDLVGLTLVDEKGIDRGTVAEVLEGGGGIILSVRRPDGRTFELPFAADLCTEIDLETRRMRVSLPEGLDDLDSID
jgi:16S rRNA processing protein RimM